MNAKEKALNASRAASHVAITKSISQHCDDINSAADALADICPTAAAALRDSTGALQPAMDGHTSLAQGYVDACGKADDADEIEKVDEGDERSDLRKLLGAVERLLVQVVPTAASVIPRTDNQFVLRAGQPSQIEREKYEKKVPEQLGAVLFDKTQAAT